MIGRDHRPLRGGRCPALRAPSVGRHAIAEGAADHVYEIAEPKDDERLPHADRNRRFEMVHEQIGQRRADHRAAGKPHDRHAGRHAAPVREPFDERRHRGNSQGQVRSRRLRPSRSKASIADAFYADRRYHQSAAPAERRLHARLAWPPAKLFRKNDARKTPHRRRCASRQPLRPSQRISPLHVVRHVHSQCARKMSDLQRGETIRSRGSFAPPFQGVRWCFGRVSVFWRPIAGSPAAFPLKARELLAAPAATVRPATGSPRPRLAARRRQRRAPARTSRKARRANCSRRTRRGHRRR